jgi:hypothetical protein
MTDTNMRSFHEWLHDDYPELPDLITRWMICSQCRGDGTSTAYLGAYTQADRDEMGDEWYEFADDIRAGHYDRACDHCDGTGKVRDVDESATHPRTLEHWADWERARYEDLAVEAMERRMGA